MESDAKRKLILQENIFKLYNENTLQQNLLTNADS